MSRGSRKSCREDKFGSKKTNHFSMPEEMDDWINRTNYWEDRIDFKKRTGPQDYEKYFGYEDIRGYRSSHVSENDHIFERDQPNDIKFDEFALETCKKHNIDYLAICGFSKKKK